MVEQRKSFLPRAGLLVALGILIPFVTGHGFGMAGNILLPMHFTVLLSGFLLGPQGGLLVGVMTPILSSLLTGMPPAFPMLPAMVGELGTYGLATGALWQRGKGLYISLLGAMVLGRVVHALLMVCFIAWQGKAIGFSLLFFLVQGIPGTVLQLVLLPAILRRLGLERPAATETDLCRPTPAVLQKGNDSMETLIQEQMEQILHHGQSIALIKNHNVIFTDRSRGVMPLLKLLDKQPELLRDALVVDKIIGKAAAMLLTLGGVKEIHTYMLSQNGRAFLERHHIPVTAQCDIDMIQNRQKDGICPFEKSVLDTEDLEEAYARLKATARRLMAGHTPREGRKEA
ncbi:ECF transporter S component [Acidaminococcus timonensis]|uniref:ECF transporter S component n=1 Tax=Acidaminococcus timonensis TaxID=1871002 RepID=UPI00307B6B1A